MARELKAPGFGHIYIEAACGCLITGNRLASAGGIPKLGPHEALTAFYYDTVSRFRQAVATRDTDEVRTLSGVRNLAGYFGVFLKTKVRFRPLTNLRRYFFCWRAMSMVAVAANGDIYPCHRFVGAPGFRMGNVHTGEFSREEFLRSPVVENPECTSCWARYMCGGGCQHDNAATGDPMRPDPRGCADRRACIEYAIHAVDGLSDADRAWVAEFGINEEQKCTVDI